MTVNKYLVKENRVISSGLLLTDKKRFLACHSTKTGMFDLPKGKAERKESVYQACIREVREETGLDISSLPLTHLGLYDYNESKFLNLFVLITHELPDIKDLRCDSYYERNGHRFPEVKGYRYVHFDAANQIMTPCMKRLISKVREDIRYYPHLPNIDFSPSFTENQKQTVSNF